MKKALLAILLISAILLSGCSQKLTDDLPESGKNETQENPGPQISEELESNPCEGITCEDYCNGTERKYSGACTNGICSYQTENNSKICGYEEPVEIDPACEGITCEDYCQGTLRLYDGYCSNGECVQYKVEMNSAACDDEEQQDFPKTCSELGGNICSNNGICVVNIHYSAEDFIDASDTTYCCPSYTDCAKGDLSISGPFTYEDKGGYAYVIGNVSNSIATIEPISINKLNYKIYVNNELKNEYYLQRYDKSTTVVAPNLNKYYFYCEDCPNLIGQTVRIEIDSDNQVKETNENNNSHEEIITLN